jgi:putative flippase GtrA
MAEPRYPVITFVVKSQGLLAIGAALLLLALFLVAAWLCEAPLLALLGLVLAGVVWFLVKLLGEVVQVIAETLLPR